MPHTEKAKTYLASLQLATREHIGSKELSPEEYDDFYQRVIENMIRGGAISEDQRESLLRSMRDEYAELSTKLPTPYQNVSTYSLIYRFQQRLATSSPKCIGKPLPDVVLGTLATGRVNAMAVQVPDTDASIVAIDEGLFGFANLMCKALAQAIPFVRQEDDGMVFSTDPDLIGEHLRTNRTAQQRFHEVLFAYLLVGHPHAAPPYILGGPPSRMAEVLRDSTEYFVLGHEYGHVTCGHMGERNALSLRVAGRPVTEIVRNYEQEFEADTIGMVLAVQSVIDEQRMALPLAYAGADLFLSLCSLVERSLALVRFGEEREQWSETHPPTTLRRERLRNMLKLISERNEQTQAAEAALKLAQSLETIVETLFQGEIPSLLAARKERVPLARMWSVMHR